MADVMAMASRAPRPVAQPASVATPLASPLPPRLVGRAKKASLPVPAPAPLVVRVCPRADTGCGHIIGNGPFSKPLSDLFSLLDALVAAGAPFGNVQSCEEVICAQLTEER